MNGYFETGLGQIVISSRVVARIAGLSALECIGIVGMAALSRSDGLVKLLTRDSISKGVNVTMSEGGVALDFHVIVAYGANIPAVAENLVSNVTYAVENATGFKVTAINVYVEGVRVID